MATSKITYRIDGAVNEKIKALAREKGTTITALVNEALLKFVREETAEQQQKTVAPLIQAAVTTAIKKAEDRLAALLVRSAIDNLTTTYAVSELINIIVDDPNAANEIMAKAKQLAVKKITELPKAKKAGDQ
jgi:hypothetical protein